MTIKYLINMLKDLDPEFTVVLDNGGEMYSPSCMELGFIDNDYAGYGEFDNKAEVPNAVLIL